MWRVRAVATGTVRWSLDTAHHGFDTMGPCVIAPESGKVKGFEKQKGRVRPLPAPPFAPAPGASAPRRAAVNRGRIQLGHFFSRLIVSSHSLLTASFKLSGP